MDAKKDLGGVWFNSRRFAEPFLDFRWVFRRKKEETLTKEVDPGEAFSESSCLFVFPYHMATL